jgi:hypothetical protein
MLRINCGVALAMMVLSGCSPSRAILSYEDSGETGGEQVEVDTTTSEEDSGSTTDDDGSPLLDLEEAPEIHPCDGLGTGTGDDISELVGPTHHDGYLYWGEWGQSAQQPAPVLTWRREELVVGGDVTVLHSSASSPAHSVVADEHYLYASSLDGNPFRLPLGGGFPETIPAPLGYAESSGELLLLADHLYWLNHSIDEITLMRTQLGPLSSEVLLDGPLGEQLTASEEAGIYVLRPAGPSTEILRVDPISGTSETLISVPAISENVGELLAVQDDLYVVYTSADTAQIDHVTLEGVVTTIVEPGTYTLITHPAIWQDQLYFEFVDPEIPDPEYAWGRVYLDGGMVELLGPEKSGPSPFPNWQRWHPMVALEDCLVVRVAVPDDANNSTFQITHFDG